MNPIAHLQFLPLSFSIRFNKQVEHPVPPMFVIRSLIGANLREISCIARKKTCSECEHNMTCIFASVFDTIHDKKNPIYQGRERAPHPFIISSNSWNMDSSNKLEFTILLFGNAVEYAPYVYGAIERGQHKGFGRNRVQYKIESLHSRNISLLDSDGNLHFQNKYLVWKSSGNYRKETRTEAKVLIKLLSPLRFKHQGAFQDVISTQSLFACFHRRMSIICALYGSFHEPPNLDSRISKTSDSTFWKDYVHFSSRQRQKMMLGGVMGEIVLEGMFSDYEIDLLSFCELFHAGKNTSFGFGKISVWKSF